MSNSHNIQVLASFPRRLGLGIDLDLHADNWHWVHCLKLPLDTLNERQFSHKPYKWIRYAIGIVVGAEGHLSYSLNFSDAVDYDADLPTNSVDLYYHINDEEKQRMFPIDPKLGHATLTSSFTSTRRDDFRTLVSERDGSRCVLTGDWEDLCDATHLLAHSKGNSYISLYTTRRKRDPAGGNTIEDIDNVRNGLLLNKVAHVRLGKDIALLPTPNFAMDTTDIDPNAPHGHGLCTAHHFIPDALGSLTASSPTNAHIRISDSPDWPPDILFDVVYATAVLRHFGTPNLIDEITATWSDTFYPGGIMTAAQAEQRKRDEHQQREARKDARDKRRAAPDAFDILIALPYINVPRNELWEYFQEAREKAEAEEVRRVRDKVESWKRQINSPSP